MNGPLHHPTGRARSLLVAAVAATLVTGCGATSEPPLPPRAEFAPRPNVISEADITAAAAGSAEYETVTTALRYWQAIQFSDVAAAYRMLDASLRQRVSPEAFRRGVERTLDHFVGVPHVVDLKPERRATTVFLRVAQRAAGQPGAGASVVVTRTPAGHRIGGDAGTVVRAPVDRGTAR